MESGPVTGYIAEGSSGGNRYFVRFMVPQTNVCGQYAYDGKLL